jgi:hypothetical protein
MNELFQSILPGLGAFGPFAVLAWWIINRQSRDIEAKDASYKELVKVLIAMGERSSQVMAELKAAIKGAD